MNIQDVQLQLEKLQKVKKRKYNYHNYLKAVDYGRYAYWFLVPFALAFLIFQFYPMLNTFYNSLVFTFKNGRNVVSAPGLSFGNYENYVFGEAGGGEFWQALIITLVMWMINFIPQFIVSMMFAAWFTDRNYKLKGVKVYRFIMFMPNIITAATVSVLFFNLLYGHGPIVMLFEKMGKTLDINSGWTSLIAVAFIQFWMWFGNTMIIMISGMMGISPTMYEAARIDGATPFQQFYKITLPLLKPVIQYVLITSLVGGLQMFDIPYLFNSGGPIVTIGNTPINSTRTVVMLIKKYATPGETLNFGKASAYSVILFLITLVISIIFYKLTAEHESRKRHIV